MANTYKPRRKGRDGQVSMRLFGPRGGRTGIERTVVKNEPFPPTLKPGQQYQMVDPTKNGSGRKK